MKNKIICILLLTSINLFSQSNFSLFKKISCQKKWWVVLHPFKAKRALEISKETKRVSDSIKASNLLDKDGSGGQVDAFRHAYWMARLRQEIGKNAAKSLGKAHEKENYKTYKKRKLEDGVVPDEISSEMDLFNNNVGLSLAKKGELTSRNGLIYRIINAIKAGKLRIIKKDKKGNFLTCDNKVIDSKLLKGKWKNNKCLVKSNFIELN